MRLFEEKPTCTNCTSESVTIAYKEIPYPNAMGLTGGFICQCNRCKTSWTMYREGEGASQNASN